MMRQRVSCGRWLGVIAACAVLCLAALSLCACKTTDLFTEIILDPWSEIPWENMDPSRVNNPDAEEESSFETSFDWTDESRSSETVENLVVYSSEPNMDLTTHHTRFDYPSMFEEIEASDGVHFIFAADSDFEHTSDANSQDQSGDSDVSSQGGDTGTGQEKPDNSEETDQTTEAQSGLVSEGAPGGNNWDSSTGDYAGEGANGNSEGDEPGGESPVDEGKGENDEGDEGTQDDPYAGYDGTLLKYDPNNKRLKIQEVDHLAVLGTDAAVLVQALGGKGAICAMSRWAYSGKDEDGEDAAYVSTFKEVFSEQLPKNFEQDALLWKRDGTDSDDLTDIDALIDACGEKGDIIYEDDLGDPTDFFTKKQRQKLEKAQIQFIPVDFSTVDATIDAATAVGKALKKSKDTAKDAKAMADAYKSCVKAIVTACGDTHGGTLATGMVYQYNTMMTEYSACPLNKSQTDTYSYIAIDSEAGVSFDNGYGSKKVDATDILLYSKYNSGKTPLSFWQQVAGVWCGETTSSGMNLLWPLYRSTQPSAKNLSGYASNGATATWLDKDSPAVNTMSVEAGEGNGGVYILSDGLGTSHVPYLIVCPSSDGKLTANQVKNKTVQSINAYIDDKKITPYAALPQEQSLVGTDTTGTGVSTVGVTSGKELSSNLFYKTPSLAEDTVRVNPTGLLASWTEGNMESVLEAVWLTELYSYSPDGCSYSPVAKMNGSRNKYNVTISAGDYEKTISGSSKTPAKDTIEAFYEAFYDYDISNSTYNKVVPDQYDGLK